MAHLIHDDRSPFGTYAPPAAIRALIAIARTTPIGRGRLRGLAMQALLRRLPSGIIDTALYGQPARLYPGDNASEGKALLAPAVYNSQEFEFLRGGLPNRDARLVDIGANSGLYVLQALSWTAPGLRILAVEPSPRALPRLRFNLRTALADGRVQLAACAAGASDGEVSFALPDGLGGAHVASQRSAYPQTTVPMRPLAALLAEAGFDRIDALKIDVEDYEADVLMPYFATAHRAAWPRRITIEHRGPASLQLDPIRFCLANGYELRALLRSNALLELS